MTDAKTIAAARLAKIEYPKDSLRKPPPYTCTTPIIFEVVKNGERREVTIPPERAFDQMPVYGFHFSLMDGGGGEIRIKHADQT